MEEEKQRGELIMYNYVKDGVTYSTPHEQVAAIRSDNGEYFADYSITPEKNNTN